MAWNLSLLVLAGMIVESDETLPEFAARQSLRTSIRSEEGLHEWHEDLETARAEAELLGLPMVIHLAAEWCEPCQQMEREVLNDPMLIGLFGHQIVGVKLDAGADPKLLERFSVQSFPTDVLVAADGAVIARMAGYREPREYLEQVERLSESRRLQSEFGIKIGPDFRENPSLGTGRPCLIQADQGIVGLRGFSPVSLVLNRSWNSGSPEFAAKVAGVWYFMSSQQELETFNQNRERFTPGLQGCDPVLLASNATILPGRISLGAYYQGRFYFFDSDESRNLFKLNPRRYTTGTRPLTAHSIAVGLN